MVNVTLSSAERTAHCADTTLFNKPPHKQEIFFDDGSVRVIENVVKIEQGRWHHILTEDGTEYITNPDRILFVRVYKNGK